MQLSLAKDIYMPDYDAEKSNFPNHHLYHPYTLKYS
jgi:hypothetical protein